VFPRGYPFEYPLTWCLGVTFDPDDVKGSIGRGLNQGAAEGSRLLPLIRRHLGSRERQQEQLEGDSRDQVLQLSMR